ncbi:HNH endonuclease signature motif containing protein [Pseudonocardia asaccharolytica]|uniref:HNH nuclease domain-containing protein n=1 Tax=Pseudonocardia asaccharolytica DSM 44247 = NBRC 16224 TaxID=1123024 RepID=A0A511D2I1_9PSEU|nr:HNH endonuclease signature motif containing protein [Pseudonocardia asaccharolytica]GEL17118.1 hypothetical protein PA7_09550 [Pseudonocardia asaccharolytica DSM 44247 = NBRC 16224]
MATGDAAGWGSAEPGPGLAAALNALDLAAVPNSEIVDVLQASWRQVSHSYARFLAAIVEVSRTASVPDDPAAEGAVRRSQAVGDWASAEIGAALTFTGRRADAELAFAQTLVLDLPMVFAALLAGRIDHLKARVFADYLGDLTAQQIAVICERTVPCAPSWTTGQLALRLLREVQNIDPDAARRRYQRAVRERGVSGYLDSTGTARITAYGLPPAEAAAAAERLERLARSVKAAGHSAPERMLQADLLLRLLDGRYDGLSREQIIAAMLADPSTFPDQDAKGGSGGATTSARRAGAAGSVVLARAATRRRSRRGGTTGPASRTRRASRREAATTRRPHPEGPPAIRSRAGVEVRIGLSTLLGLNENTAELPGWGPIVAADARTLVALQHAGEWRIAITDDEGYLAHGAITRKRPRGHSLDDSARGGVVEIHVQARFLERLTAGEVDLDETTATAWAGVIADIAAQYRDRGSALRRIEAHPRDRFARAALRRYVQMRDRTCVAPGCWRPALKTDTDHTRDHWLGGDTVSGNLEPLCEQHHLMKQAGWTLIQTAPGTFRWRSPLGQVYLTRGDPIAADLPEPVPREPEPGSGEPPEPD